MVQTLIIPRDYCGQRIDAVLAQLLPTYSRSQLTQWLKLGLLTVNAAIIKPKEKVIGGEFISLTVPKEEKTQLVAENIPLNIIFEDEDLLVVNKEAGIVVHPGAANYEHTLVNALLYYHSELNLLPRAGIVHRLDKDTTGLLVVAKTLDSHTALTRLMQNREIKRHYLALVQGHLISGGEINTFYGRHPHQRIKMAVCKQGREAITHYTINKQYGFFTLLNVQLFTGRTHQIRVHTAYIKHPIVGDPLYGSRIRIPVQASPELIQQLQQFKRQALHAVTLSFNHPFSEQPLTFTAPIPDDFSTLLQALDEYLVLFDS